MLELPRGSIALPAFLPDATRASVRGVDAGDLETVGVPGVVMNVFHLMQRPGSSTVEALGGLHRMAGWNGPIVTDSGGFQAYSLVRERPGYGRLDDKGITWKRAGTERKFHLTPEKSVQLQVRFGSDLVICLDDCTHVDDPPEVQVRSVERTLAWAKAGKAAFVRAMEDRGVEEGKRPRLFAVVQGGGSRDLRRRCAEGLLETGFDGYAFGGWPLDREGRLLEDSLSFVRELVPPNKPLFGLGIAHPANVAVASRLGYDLFDGAMPTRDARHGRLYVLREAPDEWSFLDLRRERNVKDTEPLSPSCDCPTCGRYSKGYLHHLFTVRDPLYARLATLHNLRFMVRFMEGLGTGAVEDEPVSTP